MKRRGKYLSLILILVGFLLFSAISSNIQAAQSTQQAPAKVAEKTDPGLWRNFADCRTVRRNINRLPSETAESKLKPTSSAGYRDSLPY